MPNTSIYLSDETMGRLESMAAEQGRSVSNLIAYLVNQAWMRATLVPALEEKKPCEETK